MLKSGKIHPTAASQPPAVPACKTEFFKECFFYYSYKKGYIYFRILQAVAAVKSDLFAPWGVTCA